MRFLAAAPHKGRPEPTRDGWTHNVSQSGVIQGLEWRLNCKATMITSLFEQQAKILSAARKMLVVKKSTLRGP